MKKPILLAVLVIAAIHLPAQLPSPNPFPKTITVEGSAEMEVIPDEIHVAITLREYQKKGENKKELEAIRQHFLESCRAVGIPDSLISVAAYTGFNNYYQLRKKKKDPNMMARIVYQVKFRSTSTMDALIEKLDDEATENFQVVNTSHSKITEFRKQLKIKAIQAAKEKALYLTEAIQEKLGHAITVTEPSEFNPIRPMTSIGYSNIRVAGIERENADMYKEQEIDFKKMKLRFEVSVIFALQ
jgi:uncharacterized protein YggE